MRAALEQRGYAFSEATRAMAMPASLQSTSIAEHVYAAVGFRDLGRFLEYSPVRRVASK